jgi:raffinose/stachyose/melibiose transport system substrate-binding protein
MKRILTIITCIALLAGILTACQPAAATPASSAPAPAESPSVAPAVSSAAPASAEPAKPEKVSLKFFTGKMETIDLMNDIINAFNAENNGITVEQEYQREASNIIKIKFASGEVPDLMTVYEQGYVDEGKYMDLSNEAWWSRLIPSMKESCTDIKTGKQFRICTNMTMAGFFYNKDIFNELGLKPATTWDEFVSNLQAIKSKKKDITPWFIFGKEAWHLGHLIEFLPHGYIKQKYGAIEAKKAMLANDDSKLGFGDPAGAMAVFAKDLLDLKAKGLINSDVLTATSDNCVQAFATGKAAMLSNGMWVLSSLLEANPEMADKIGFAPYPAIMPDMKPVVLVAEDSGYSISADTKNADAVRKFMDYLFSADNQKKYSETLKSPSAFTDVKSEWAPANVMSEVTSAVSSAVNIGFTNEKPAGFTGDDAGRMVQDLLAGKYTPETFAAAYKKAWDDGMK